MQIPKRGNGRWNQALDTRKPIFTSSLEPLRESGLGGRSRGEGLLPNRTETGQITQWATFLGGENTAGNRTKMGTHWNSGKKGFTKKDSGRELEKKKGDLQVCLRRESLRPLGGTEGGRRTLRYSVETFLGGRTHLDQGETSGKLVEETVAFTWTGRSEKKRGRPMMRETMALSTQKKKGRIIKRKIGQT